MAFWESPVRPAGRGRERAVTDSHTTIEHGLDVFQLHNGRVRSIPIATRSAGLKCRNWFWMNQLAVPGPTETAIGRYRVGLDGQEPKQFSCDSVILAEPPGKETELLVEASPW